jgi:hypothetical protein
MGGYSVSQVRKAIVAWIGAALILVNSALTVFADYISADAALWINGAIGVVTAVSVYLVTNAGLIDSLGSGRPQVPPGS